MPLIRIDNSKRNNINEITTLRRSLISEGDIISANTDERFSFGSTEIIGKAKHITKAGKTLEYDADGTLVNAYPATTVDLDGDYVLATTNDYIAEVEKIDVKSLISISRRNLGQKLKHPVFVVPGRVYAFECRYDKTPFVAVMTVGNVTFTRKSDNMELPVNTPNSNQNLNPVEHFIKVFESLKTDASLGLKDKTIEKPSDVDSIIKQLPDDIFNFNDKQGNPIVSHVHIDAIYPVS